MTVFRFALIVAALVAWAPVYVGAQGDRPMIQVTPGKTRAFKAAVQQFAEPRAQVAEGHPLPAERAPRFREEIEKGLEYSGTVVPSPSRHTWRRRSPRKSWNVVATTAQTGLGWESMCWWKER